MKLLQSLLALKTTFLTFNLSTEYFLYRGKRIRFEKEATVLDALLDAGHPITYGCRAGVCQSCLMQSGSTVSSSAQAGLSIAQKKLNYFLSCQCKAETGLEILDANTASTKFSAKVKEKQFLNDHVLQLKLIVDESSSVFEYYPGQYVTLWKASSGKQQTTTTSNSSTNAPVTRSYSLSSVPEQDDFLEFHIKVIEDGAFSQWAATELNVDDPIEIQGPIGQCIYNDQSEQPLLLAAIGTGLAPIYGILKQALQANHKAEINLVIGALEPEGFYLVDELLSLTDQYEHLHVHFIAQNGEAPYARNGDLYEYCKEAFPDLKGQRVFLCGANSFVQKMKKQCFLSGASMSDISADAFLPCH